jgi:hypothetical protein
VESWARLPGGRSRHEIRYGLTSLPAAAASPERLLALVRGQWAIENGLHYRRDATLREDHSQLLCWLLGTSVRKVDGFAFDSFIFLAALGLHR